VAALRGVKHRGLVVEARDEVSINEQVAQHHDSDAVDVRLVGPERRGHTVARLFAARGIDPATIS